MSFERTEETITACRKAGIAVEVVPGITSTSRIDAPDREEGQDPRGLSGEPVKIIYRALRDST